MKTRVLVAAVGIPLLVVVIFFAPLWLTAAVVGIISAGCAWELLRCTDLDLPVRMLVYVAVSGFAVPFSLIFFDAGRVYFTVLFALFALMFCELMFSFRDGQPMALESVTSALLAGGVMPVLLSGIVLLGQRENASLYMFLPFVVAFSSDSGAYFAGSFLGRHKLTPHLSPNKTIEGSIGGFAAAVALAALYGLILKTAKLEVNMPVMCVYGFLGSLACQLGDLGFSAIKRLCGVKDYGNLIPGHGGMLDRFDSMHWTAALLLVLVNWVPAIK